MLAVACNLKSQTCGSKDPELDSPYYQWFNRIASEGSYQKVNALKIIPVAVHVIYRRESDDHNISDDQIQSQIDILNDDFRGRGGGVDTEVEFCLAGINRIRSRDHYQVIRGTNDIQAKALSQADPTRFLNIWIVDLLQDELGGNILGFAQFPFEFGSSPQTDGVMIPDHYFGNLGTALGSHHLSI